MPAELPEIAVVAGVLTASDGRVLIAQRPSHKAQGGAWEFPGGKISAAETPLQGLLRELDEELGIRVTLARHLTRYCHDYPDKRVHLHVWKVLAWMGEPSGCEQQPLAWLRPDRLLAHGLLPADERIVEILHTDAAVNRIAVENCLRQKS